MTRVPMLATTTPTPVSCSANQKPWYKSVLVNINFNMENTLVNNSPGALLSPPFTSRMTAPMLATITPTPESPTSRKPSFIGRSRTSSRRRANPTNWTDAGTRTPPGTTRRHRSGTSKGRPTRLCTLITSRRRSTAGLPWRRMFWYHWPRPRYLQGYV